MAPSFLRVNSTVSPCLTWMIGPGAVPSNVHAAYFTPGAISWTSSLAVKVIWCTVRAGADGSVASYAFGAAAAGALALAAGALMSISGMLLTAGAVGAAEGDGLTCTSRLGALAAASRAATASGDVPCL